MKQTCLGTQIVWCKVNLLPSPAPGLTEHTWSPLSHGTLCSLHPLCVRSFVRNMRSKAWRVALHQTCIALLHLRQIGSKWNPDISSKWLTSGAQQSYVKSVFSVNVEDLRRAVDRRVGVSINWQFASKCVFDDPTDHLISPRARCQCSNISDTLSFIGDF